MVPVPRAGPSLFSPPTGLPQHFLSRYDGDKDFQLTQSEIGLDDEAFAALDRDGNGKLDVPELAEVAECSGAHG